MGYGRGLDWEWNCTFLPHSMVPFRPKACSEAVFADAVICLTISIWVLVPIVSLSYYIRSGQSDICSVIRQDDVQFLIAYLLLGFLACLFWFIAVFAYGVIILLTIYLVIENRRHGNLHPGQDNQIEIITPSNPTTPPNPTTQRIEPKYLISPTPTNPPPPS